MSDASKLMTQQTDFAKLADRYGNFMVPTAHVSINGTRLTKLNIVVESLSVSLSVEMNSASFTLLNVYEQGSRSFRKEAAKVAVPGAVVSVELGYGSSLFEVFYGYIHEVSYEVSDHTSISVTALDARRLMQEQNAYLKKYAQEDCKSILNKVLEGYKPLIKTVHFEGDLSKQSLALQKGSDLDYVHAICNECDMEFLLLGNECWIRPMESKKSVIMKLEGNRSLIRFTRSMVYKNLILRTRVIDETAATQGKEQPAAVKIEVNPNKKYTYDLGISQEQFIRSDRTDDADTAKKRLEKKMHEMMRNTQGGGGESIGLPDLIPGRHIEITDMDEMMNGIYYLTSVTHSFGENGYTTDFTIGGYGE